jgi:hypothetical protein
MPSRRDRPTGARRFPLFRTVASGLVTIVAAASLLGTFAPTAAVADQDHWENIHQIDNQTVFELRPLDQTKTEMTDWIHRPEQVIPPGGENVGVVRSAGFSFGHGLAQLLSYAMYDKDDYVGMVVFSSGLDCQLSVKVCLDYHRWQRTWSSPLAGKYSKYMLDTDVRDGGSQYGYQVNTKIYLRPVRSGAESSVGSSIETQGAQAQDAQEPITQDAPDSQGLPWAWRQLVQNQTPYDLAFGFSWASQGTDTAGLEPPAAIPSGSLGTYSYANSKTYHGPQMFTVYNAYRPGTKDYVGSMIIEAQTDCNAGAKVPDLPSCIEAEWNSYSIAAGTDMTGPQKWALAAHSDTSGVPPLFAVAETVLRLDPVPTPEPTPTPTPDPDPTPVPDKAATTIVLQPASTPIHSGSLNQLWGYVRFPLGDDKPTGTVSFYDGDTLLGVGGVNPGDATYNASTMVQIITQGAHDLRAVYSGDDKFAGSETSGTWNVEKPTPELSIQSSADPAAAGSSPVIAVQAFIPGAQSLPDDGTVIVSVSDDSANRFEGTVKNGLVLGTLPKALPPGDHEIGASWRRDGVVVAGVYFIQSVSAGAVGSPDDPAELGPSTWTDAEQATLSASEATDAATDPSAAPAVGEMVATSVAGEPLPDAANPGASFQLWESATPELSIRFSANPAPAGSSPVIVLQGFVPGAPSLPNDGRMIVTVSGDNSNRFEGTLKNGLLFGTLSKPLPPGDHEIGASWRRDGVFITSAFATLSISAAIVGNPGETPTATPEPSSTPAAAATTATGGTGRLADTGEAPLGAAAAAALLLAVGATLTLIRRRRRAGLNL